MEAIVSAHCPGDAAVEAPFHGVSARSALQLAHARGVILAVLGSAGVPVHEYSPATIKKAVTGSGRAEKDQVKSMVRHFVPDVGNQASADAADAIATALCHLFGQATTEALARAGVIQRRSR
jgi:crossover junction endodeoxyribonuclease RuvC